MSMDFDEEDLAAAQTLASFPALDPDQVLAELQDPAVDAAFADAVAAVESMGGRRKSRGGVKRSATAAFEASPPTPIVAPPPSSEAPPAKRERAGPTILDGVKEKLNTVRSAVVPATTAIAIGTALNRPTVYGNLARLVAEVIKTGTNTTIQSTWGDWGQAILDIAKSVGVVGELLAAQTAQGPVVPVSIATAILMYRAQKSGKTLAKLIQDDAAAVQSGARGLAKAQVDAFQTAIKEEGFRANVSTLKEIAAKARRSAPSGEGAAAMTAAITSLGAPAVGSTGVVPGFAPPGPPGQPIAALAAAPPGAIADATAARAAAGALLTLATVASPSDIGGRRARRRRKTKRRVPKRKRTTRKLLTFVY
jgi:hypothetical protein